jgi:hypothetical protein
MGEKKCLGFADTSEVNLPPKIEVRKSSNRLAGRACPVFDDKAGVLYRRIFRSEFFFHFCLCYLEIGSSHRRHLSTICRCTESADLEDDLGSLKE